MHGFLFMSGGRAGEVVRMCGVCNDHVLACLAARTAAAAEEEEDEEDGEEALASEISWGDTSFLFSR